MAEPRPSARAEQAWADYLALGDQRSLDKLAAFYHTQTTPVPTKHVQTLKLWSTAYKWQARLAALIDQQNAASEARIKRQRAEVFETGYGLDFERVRVLKRLAEKLVEDLLSDAADEADGDGLEDWARAVQDALGQVEQILQGTWRPAQDAKKRTASLWGYEPQMLGGGKGARLAMLRAMKVDELNALRGLLNDIALETGGRPRQIKVSIDQRLKVVAEEEARKYGMSPEEVQAEADAVLREMHAGGNGRS